MEIGLSINQVTNDLELDENHSLIVVTRSAAIAQHVRQRLNTFQGEWYLNTDAGVRWLDDILGQAYDPVLTETTVKQVILDTAGVREIIRFDVNFKNDIRELNINVIEILSIYDEIIRINT